MILGMTIQVFIHVVISLIAIVAGFVVLAGLFKARPLEGWTAWFLILSVATSLTGVVLPATQILPSHITAILALAVLLVTVPAKYTFDMHGGWRKVYVIGAVISLYLNVFVLIVQAFLKVPALKALAPTGSEAPFAIVQGLVLLGFIINGYLAVKRFAPRDVLTSA